MVNPQIASAVEQLDYRVTVGEVAAHAGIEINSAQAGVLALATDVGANLQVAESGDITYIFPRNYHSILRNKYWRLRFQDLWQKLWAVLFYLIRISFGIFLILSIMLIFAAIAVIVIAYSSSQEGDQRRSSGLNVGSLFWIDDLWWWFRPNYNRRRKHKNTNSMNFFEAVFSVLFGDGNPNANLEEKRWQSIGAVIRNNQGAIVAEQVMPYLELPPALIDEDFMIPILSRFNGYPEVTGQGGLLYRFPELQTVAVKRKQQSVPSTLRETLWPFTAASSGQVGWTIGLGLLNITGAVLLSTMLRDGAIALGGFVGFVSSILWVLLAYGIGFLVIPLGRHLWIQRQNKHIQSRNDQRLQRAIAVQSPNPDLRQKLDAAQTYRNEVDLSQEQLAYTTETDLIEQAFEE